MSKVMATIVGILLFASQHAAASPSCSLTMAETFTDDMVLQSTEPVVAGRCKAPADITVALLNSAGATVASKQGSCQNGRFLVQLAPRKPSAEKFSIDVKCGGSVKATAKGIMFGTVILCSGQSNMGLATSQEDDHAKELAEATAANYPLVRLFGIKSQNTSSEATALVPRWKVGWTNLTFPRNHNPAASPAGQFSAVCWNMGKELSARLAANGTQTSHPIGLIDGALGSTSIECWLPPSAVKKAQPCWSAHLAPKKTLGNNCTHVEWSGPPGAFYHGMIEPLTRSVRVAAIVYYQGENNMWDGIDEYHCSGDALAESWREAFGEAGAAAVPWFIVQLAPCCGNNDGLVAGSDIREAQRRSSLTVPDAHLIVLNDIGDAGASNKKSGFGPETHPKNKTEAGRRLGLQVWGRVFDSTHTAKSSPKQLTGPILHSVSFADKSRRSVRVEFESMSAGGLHWMPTHNCSVYKTIGEACCNARTQSAQFSNASTPDASYNEYDFWVDAPAKIDGTGLVADVPAHVGVPRWMRIQYTSQPPCVLANAALLPTSLFVSELAAGQEVFVI